MFDVNSRSHDRSQDFSKALECLERLHLVQEMITLCRTFLSSNQECLSSVAQQALRHFKPQTEDNKEGNTRKLENRLKLLVQVYIGTVIK